MWPGINRIELQEQIKLLAPTGRASKRMMESTNLEAQTIHRFLKWNKEDNTFQVNEECPCTSELIIIDESSMIDVSLMEALLKGLTSNIKLIFVGDKNQLPSVGPGNILKDLIDTEIVETVYLDQLYRQTENSYINKLASEIKDEELSPDFFVPRDDYRFIECPSAMIKEQIKYTVKELSEKGYDYKRLQLMAPMYNGENGITNLNAELQSILNPYDKDKKELLYGDTTFRVGDKVIQLVNFQDLQIYNGDIGIILDIIDPGKSESKTHEFIIDFDGREVVIPSTHFSKLKHAFIISIHKSQGSEFEMVVMPICRSYNRMLYKKLVYTAITRAKRRLIIIGETDAFVTAVRINREYNRSTLLFHKINISLYKMSENG